MVVLRFDGGQYALPRVALGPFQTVTGSLKEAIAKGKKDLDGNSPRRSAAGRYSGFKRSRILSSGGLDVRHESGSGREFQLLLSVHMFAAYFTPQPSDTWLFPSSITLPYLGLQPISTRQRRYDCNNSNLGAFDVTSSTTYSSGNGAIFSFSNSTIQAVGIGSTTFGGQAPRNTDTPPHCPVQSQTSPGGNGTVQKPSSLKVISAKSVGCPPDANYGIMIDVTYQVLDAATTPILSSGMVPYEKVTWVDGSKDDKQLGDATDSQGEFHDNPVGVCLSLPFTKDLKTTQEIRMRVNQTDYVVRSQTFTITAPSGAAGFGHGTIKNGSDINVSR